MNIPVEFFLNKKLAERYFDLSLIFWSRDALENLRDQIPRWKEGEFPSEETQEEFKRIRGQFKKLRFSFIAFSKDHEIPEQLNELVVQLGKVRDAWKRRDPEVYRRLNKLEISLSDKNLNKIEREIDQFEATKRSHWEDRIKDLVKDLSKIESRGSIKAEVFHETRKKIGVLLLFSEIRYSQNLRLDSFEILMFLRTLNFQMGEFHDHLVAAGPEAYNSEKYQVPSPIRMALLALRNQIIVN